MPPEVGGPQFFSFSEHFLMYGFDDKLICLKMRLSVRFDIAEVEYEL